MKKKKKGGSFFGGLIAFLLVLVVISTVAVNLVFSGEKIPKIADYYLYLQETDEMAPAIPEQSLVFAKEASTGELHPGNKVLCDLADNTRAARNILRIEETEDGTMNYYMSAMNGEIEEMPIIRMNIFAVCDFASHELYQYVKFSTSVTGLLSLLVAPCVVLIIMLLVKIATNGNEEDIEDDEFEIEETEKEELRTELPKKQKKTPPVSPLYDPDKVPASKKLEEKKSSISENFSEKPVNEDSPYQKSVQEHEKTTRFRRQELQEEALKVLEAPPKKKKSSTQIYSVQEIRQEAAQAKPPVSSPASPITKPPVKEEMPAPVQETAPSISSPPAPPVKEEIPVPPMQEASAPLPPPPAVIKEEKPKPTPKPAYKSTSPNIDDILKSSDHKAGKSDISSSDSIDDLIRMLEEQKKKL